MRKNLEDFLRELKEADCLRVKEAYEALPDGARRLYTLLETAGLAIERADADDLEAIYDGMAHLQSVHCPLGQILQRAVSVELEKRGAVDRVPLAI